MDKHSRKKLDTGPIISGQASLYTRGNKIQLRLPDSVGLGRNKYISLGLPVTTAGISEATRIASVINSDIVYGKFDSTLAKYKPVYRRRSRVLETLVGVETPVYEMWLMYCDYKKKSGCKDSYFYYLKTTIGDILKKCPQQHIANGEGIYEWLLSNTKPKYALRLLQKLNLLFSWADKKGILQGQANPYGTLVARIKEEEDVESEAIARVLTKSEQSILLSSLKEEYNTVARLQLLLGSRPSEVIGLLWSSINLEDGYIVMGQSYRKKNGNVFESSTSKKGKIRLFPLYDELIAVLKDLPRYSERVVCYKDGRPINYDSYYKAWKRVMPPDTTPYCCRDTFISSQVEKGIPVGVVAKWVDNSIDTIDKHYLKISMDLKPLS